MPEGIPDEYLDMMVTCPAGYGEDEGAKPLGEVLADPELGPKIGPVAVRNFERAAKLAAAGFDHEEAVLTAFGGAIEENAEGGIVRTSDEAAQPDGQPQLAEAEKK